jgi:hypothetical protein
MSLYDDTRQELVHLAGDPDTGLAGGMNLTATALGHPTIRYGEFILTADVYAPPGAPKYLHLICPRCRNALRITEDRKAMEYDPTRDTDRGGRLDVEAFQCTWELPEANGRKIEFGMGLCRWTVAIDRNIARDA